MLLPLLVVLVSALAAALAGLLRRLARLRAEAVGVEVRLEAVRARVEDATALLARSAAEAGATVPEPPEAEPVVPSERPPRERRRTRRSPTPSVRP